MTGLGGYQDQTDFSGGLIVNFILFLHGLIIGLAIR